MLNTLLRLKLCINPSSGRSYGMLVEFRISQDLLSSYRLRRQDLYSSLTVLQLDCLSPCQQDFCFFWSWRFLREEGIWTDGRISRRALALAQSDQIEIALRFFSLYRPSFYSMYCGNTLIRMVSKAAPCRCGAIENEGDCGYKFRVLIREINEHLKHHRAPKTALACTSPH